MALGDITLWKTASTSGGRGAVLYNVAAGTPILAGEPVMLLYRTAGAVTVEPLAQVAAATGDLPITAASTLQGLLVGVASTNSTNTTAAAGTVNVIPVNQHDTWLISPKVAATFGLGSTPVQATYDALVGKRVLLENGAQRLTYAANTNAGTYSILAADGATSGCLIRAKLVTEAPGKVAISFRNSTSSEF